MKRFSLVLSLLLALAAASGCLFHRKGSKPKESAHIATDVEQGFRQRWMEKRVGELTAQGIAADAAQQQAAKEFSERYEYLQTNPQK